jgi:hypothetical protein
VCVWCARKRERVRVMKRNFQRLASATKVLICSESKEIAQSEVTFLEAALKGWVRFFEWAEYECAGRTLTVACVSS